MSKQEIIEQTVLLLEQLAEEKAAEIRDFAAFLVERKRQPIRVITEPIQETPLELKPHRPRTRVETEAASVSAEAEEGLRADLAAVVGYSKAYSFLHDEPDLYTDDDLIERYK